MFMTLTWTMMNLVMKCHLMIQIKKLIYLHLDSSLELIRKKHLNNKLQRIKNNLIQLLEKKALHKNK